MYLNGMCGTGLYSVLLLLYLFYLIINISLFEDI
jgi:hypothetical protein